MDKSIEEIEVISRIAEDELGRVWEELEHRKTPSAQDLRERIVELAQGIVPEPGPPAEPQIGVYVIELDLRVLRHKRFMKRNRKTYLPGRDCLYVGHSEKAPQHRFMQHLQGERDSWVVRKYGLRLRPEFYDAIDLFVDRDDAIAREEELAELLQSQGYGVWYN